MIWWQLNLTFVTQYLDMSKKAPAESQRKKLDKGEEQLFTKNKP